MAKPITHAKAFTSFGYRAYLDLYTIGVLAGFEKVSQGCYCLFPQRS